MITRKADARWDGGFPSGKGSMKVESGTFEGSYSFSSRFENEKATNPEELIAAAEAGCFSMALSKVLTEDDHVPESIQTTAKVNLEKNGNAFSIGSIDLDVRVEISDVSEEYLAEMAEKTKNDCIVSRALQGTSISVQSKLLAPST